MKTTFKRSLAIASMTMLTGGMLFAGAAPASAATHNGASASNGSITRNNNNDRNHDRRWHRVRDYDSRWQCEQAGRRGERRHYWDDYKCVRDRNHHNNAASFNNNRRHHNDDWTLYVRRDRHHNH